MNELGLLIFGCAVTFIAVGGAYIYLRERYLASELPSHSETEEVHTLEPAQDAA